MATLPNKPYTTKAIVFIVSLFVYLLPFLGRAQFVVKENTVFHLQGKLTSLEQKNEFQSDIQGSEGALYLMGQQQTLETASDVSLPNLVVNNASELTVLSKLQLKGKLTLKKGVLKLNHPIHIEGQIIKLHGASIENEFLVTFVKEQQQLQAANEMFSSKTATNAAIIVHYNFLNGREVLYNTSPCSNMETNCYKHFAPAPEPPPPLA